MSKRAIDVESLNPQQREAVFQTDGPVLILAGAGTGKTRVITNRIAHMVEQGIDPTTILAVTFTNKAAAEMHERIKQMLQKAASLLTVCTFHSLCVRILRRSIDRLGYKRNFTIYATSDQMGLIRKIISRTAARDEKLEPAKALSMIGSAKNASKPVSENPDDLITEIYEQYQRDLRSLNAVDFDDLLILGVQVLDENKDVREFWRERFQYSMVDEFQDTNSLQMRLLQNLVNDRHNVCVVGDDDQSIYGWRGAEIANILQFEKFFPNPKIIKLEENYRSTTPILSTANSLIKNNRDRREKSLWSRNEGDDRVRLIAMPGDREEAEFVVNEIWEEHRLKELPWEDFAVLFRMNMQSRLLETNLRELKIPYRVIGGQSFFDRREVKDILAYLMVFCNPHDDINLLRILNNPPRGIGKSTAKVATELSMDWKKSVYETLQEREFTDKLSLKVREAIEDFLDLIQENCDAAVSSTTNYGDLLVNLIDEIGYMDELTRICKKETELRMRQESVNELIQSVCDHYRKKKTGLQGYLDDTALLNDRDDEDISKKKGVCLITLHASKGLEFPRVYLVGLEEGILPHQRSVGEGRVDEERRLFYVGITRAMKSLTISYCTDRTRYGEQVPCQPSSFLKELSRDFLEEINYADVANEPASDEEVRQSFDSMKEMLSNIEGFKVE